ncbi:uncharacterized protein LOC143690081 isoform X2 [Tamandua tetradactyla]|uniref:uncharacterized protein LOC143690081 isoform X2 n=1 Tax=Tamandua tetradactyla TaxID=48850 RepID=UPI0040539121
MYDRDTFQNTHQTFANSSILILKDNFKTACSLERLGLGTAFPQPPREHRLSDCITLRSRQGDNVLFTVTGPLIAAKDQTVHDRDIFQNTPQTFRKLLRPEFER